MHQNLCLLGIALSFTVCSSSRLIGNDLKHRSTYDNDVDYFNARELASDEPSLRVRSFQDYLIIQEYAEMLERRVSEASPPSSPTKSEKTAAAEQQPKAITSAEKEEQCKVFGLSRKDHFFVTFLPDKPRVDFEELHRVSGTGFNMDSVRDGLTIFTAKKGENIPRIGSLSEFQFLVEQFCKGESFAGLG